MGYVGFPVLARCVALPASAAALALTGCASSGTTASTSQKVNAQKLIDAAYTTTTAAKSARMAMTFNSDTHTGGDMTVAGIEDFEHQSAEDTTSVAGMGTIEHRQIGLDTYIKMPDALAKLQLNHNASKPWTHIRLPKNLIPAGLSSLMGGAGPDPAGYVQLLTSVSSSVTAVGTESVRGQRSTHYRMKLDEAKIRKLDAQMGDCGDDDENSSDDNNSLNVWLDGQGRVTRIRISVNDSASTPAPGDTPTSPPSLSPSPSAAESGAVTIEFYDYGVPVSIQAPPADQTQTIPDAFGDSTNSSNSCTSVSASGGGAPS